MHVAPFNVGISGTDAVLSEARELGLIPKCMTNLLVETVEVLNRWDGCRRDAPTWISITPRWHRCTDYQHTIAVVSTHGPLRQCTFQRCAFSFEAKNRIFCISLPNYILKLSRWHLTPAHGVYTTFAIRARIYSRRLINYIVSRIFNTFLIYTWCNWLEMIRCHESFQLLICSLRIYKSIWWSHLRSLWRLLFSCNFFYEFIGLFSLHILYCVFFVFCRRYFHRCRSLGISAWGSKWSD